MIGRQIVHAISFVMMTVGVAFFFLSIVLGLCAQYFKDLP